MTDVPSPEILVEIQGVDVSEYCDSFEIIERKTGTRTGKMQLDATIVNATEMTLGATIEVWLGAVGTTLSKKIYGTITSLVNEYMSYTIEFNDEYWKASGTTLAKLYDSSLSTDTFGGDIRLIMIDIASAADLTITDSTIDMTSVIVPQVLCDNVKVDQKLSELAGVLQWDIYQNPSDRYVYVKNPALYTTYATTLEVGKNVMSSPDIQENIYQIINEIELQGVQAQPSKTASFVATSGQTEFTVGKAIGTYIEVKQNGTQLTGAVQGSTGTYDYLINNNTGTITLSIGATVGDTITILYTAPELTTVTVDDAESIGKYGRRKAIIVYNDIASVDDAFQRGTEIINATKNPFVSFSCQVTNAFDLSCRNKINFLDQTKLVQYDGLEVQIIKWKWPEAYAEVQVGKSTYSSDLLLTSVEERVKKLERTSLSNVLLTVAKNFTVNLPVILDDVEIYELSPGTMISVVKTGVKTDLAGSDTLIWGTGNWGEKKWGYASNVDASSEKGSTGATNSAWMFITDSSTGKPYYTAVQEGVHTAYDAYFLKLTGFGFEIPTDSKINGIVVTFNAKSSHKTIPTDYIYTKTISIVKSNVISSYNNTSGIYVWPTTDYTFTIGSSSDLWGENTISPADVNESTFGVAIQPSISPLIQDDVTATISEIQMRVYYTPYTKTVKSKRKTSFDSETTLLEGTHEDGLTVANGIIQFNPIERTISETLTITENVMYLNDSATSIETPASGITITESILTLVTRYAVVTNTVSISEPMVFTETINYTNDGPAATMTFEDSTTISESILVMVEKA